MFTWEVQNLRAEKTYVFSSFIDGVGKIFFTLIPLYLGLQNLSQSTTTTPTSTRISFLISALSLMFFYIVEYLQTVSRRVKIEIAYSLTLLIIPFILTLYAFHEPKVSIFDLLAFVLFMASIIPIMVESFLTFIFVDCEYQLRAEQRKKRRLHVKSWMDVRSGENS